MITLQGGGAGGGCGFMMCSAHSWQRQVVTNMCDSLLRWGWDVSVSWKDAWLYVLQQSYYRDTHLCMYVSIYIYMYMGIYVYIYVCEYICMNIYI